MKIRLSDILKYFEENCVEYTIKSRKEYSAENFCVICALNELKNNALTWVRSVENLTVEQFERYEGVWVLCSSFEQWNEYPVQGFLFVKDPFTVFFSLLDYFDINGKQECFSIGSSSIVKTKKLGKGVQIGEHCIIDEEVEIGENVVIRNNVSITGNVKIGNNTIIFSGAVIGEEGFGYFTDIQGKRKRVTHIGGVIIGENCQIGENVVIARGCLGNTILGNNVRVDSLTHIAHNVHIGDGTYIVCLVSLAGSSEIGDNTWIAPGTNVKNQVRIGNNVITGLGALVLKDLADNVVAVGSPAKVIRERKPEEEI